MATSFRDPAGYLLPVSGRILRVVNQSGEPDLRAFLDSDSARRLTDAGRLVRTRPLGQAEVARLPIVGGLRELLEQPDAVMVVEHERVPFQSFPYEWPPEMLHAAALLTLDLAEGLLDEGFGLKDATSYNVLFQGHRPVFVDWLSFERRDPCDATWRPYAQFIRTFLLPLLVNRHFGLRLDQLLLVNRDGLDPEEVYRLCGPVRKLLPPFLTLVSLPSWLASRGEAGGGDVYRQTRTESREKATFILSHLFKGLRRKLKGVAPAPGKTSVWSDYMSKNRYTEDYLPLKESFVASALGEAHAARVLDVGCNTGHFSALATRTGASVVAIDYDPVVVGQVWRGARAESLDILPLVVNLARPTPSTGWLNGECPSFIERARGSFEVVLMLAVIHHMLVTERIPLPQILGLAAELTTRLLVLEYVPPDDPMFRRIARGREHLHTALTRESFEAACRERFDIARAEALGQSGRWLYLLRKRDEVG
jgi:SAM-dependent methyltransferase